MSLKMCYLFHNTFNWYPVILTIHLACALLKSIFRLLIIMLYARFSPLPVLCSANNLGSSSLSAPFPGVPFPVFPSLISSHQFLSSSSVFATASQSIHLTLVFFNSLLSLLLFFLLRLSLLFQTFSSED